MSCAVLRCPYTQVFTPSVFGEVSLVRVAVASAATGAAASTGSVGQLVPATAEDSAASAAHPEAGGGTVEEFTAAQHALCGRAAPSPALLADVAKEQVVEPPTELELRCVGGSLAKALQGGVRPSCHRLACCLPAS